jgi:hypothetical protein
LGAFVFGKQRRRNCIHDQSSQRHFEFPYLRGQFQRFLNGEFFWQRNDDHPRSSWVLQHVPCGGRVFAQHTGRRRLGDDLGDTQHLETVPRCGSIEHHVVEGASSQGPFTIGVKPSLPEGCPLIQPGDRGQKRVSVFVPEQGLIRETTTQTYLAVVAQRALGVDPNHRQSAVHLLDITRDLEPPQHLTHLGLFGHGQQNTPPSISQCPREGNTDRGFANSTLTRDKQELTIDVTCRLTHDTSAL